MSNLGYDNKNKGVLFTNKNKKKNTQPDYQGKIDVEGKEYQLAGWHRTSKSGVKFMSLTISEPYEPQKKYEKNNIAAQAEKVNDDLPF